MARRERKRKRNTVLGIGPGSSTYNAPSNTCRGDRWLCKDFYPQARYRPNRRKASKAAPPKGRPAAAPTRGRRKITTTTAKTTKVERMANRRPVPLFADLPVLGPRAGVQAHSARSPYVVLYAKRSGGALLKYLRSGKFAARGAPRLFHTDEQARGAAMVMRETFPHAFRGYRFYVG